MRNYFSRVRNRTEWKNNNVLKRNSVAHILHENLHEVHEILQCTVITNLCPLLEDTILFYPRGSK